MSTPISGRCLCGAVQYRTSSPPLMAGHCQCTHCRKLSGTGHASIFSVPKEGLEITGELKFYQYRADSGNLVSRSFCPECGSPIYNENEGFSEMGFLHASSLDNPEQFQPQMVIYTSSAASWDKADPELPQFPKMPPMG